MSTKFAPRPHFRAPLIGLLAALVCAVAAPHGARGADAFRAFLAQLWPEAQAMGVSRATFDAAV